jgi:hypothetical protein
MKAYLDREDLRGLLFLLVVIVLTVLGGLVDLAAVG